MRFAPEESPSLQFLSFTLLLLHLPSILGFSNATTVPDWSDVSLDGHTRYLSALVIYDVSSYNLKPKLLKAEVLELFLGINEYLYQLDIRVSIADFVPLRRKSRPPLDMEAFRNYYIDMKPSYRASPTFLASFTTSSLEPRRRPSSPVRLPHNHLRAADVLQRLFSSPGAVLARCRWVRSPGCGDRPIHLLPRRHR
uniref:Uncharacterized protein n=1 Tax=Steinernema glaseri TaxID=37863 RepID=A0A1I8APT4_9BILA